MATHDNIPCCESGFWFFLMAIVGLVCFAGLMAGLTLGLMSLGLVDLEVLIKSGRPQDRIYASKIFPVVKNQHLLLCTLLLGNSLAMETLPIFLDKLLPPWAAIVISVTLILAFGEILPQAICTRYGLKVGAMMEPLVRVLLILFFPVTYPISKVLDWMLGKGHAVLLRRAELKTFVNFHGNEAGKGGDLTHDETTIIAGALELTEKTAKDAMTPISKAFSLDLDTHLNLETINEIITVGHSRVPVYAGNPTNIIGLILVKNLLAVHPKSSVPLRKMTIRKIPRVPDDMPLYDILNEFQKGHSHIAVVYRDLNGKAKSARNGRQIEIKDSCKKKQEDKSKKLGKTGIYIGHCPGLLSLILGCVVLLVILASSSLCFPGRQLLGASVQFGLLFYACYFISPVLREIDENTLSGWMPDDNEAGSGQEASMGESGWESGVTGNRTSLAKNDESQMQRKSPPPTPAFRKRHRGCSFCILDIENSSIPEFPPNEVVVGVITMEDVIEELLQEEILDETDEYVNIHNRIKVNMHAVPEKASGSNSLPAYSSASSATSTPSPTSRRLGFAGSTTTLSVSTSNSVANSPVHH